MAYINKEKTKLIREQLKLEFPEFRFSVRNSNHTAVLITVKSGPIDFFGNGLKSMDSNKTYTQINTYYPENYPFSDIIKKILDIANGGFLPSGEQNFDKSDVMTDYFHVGWYVRLSIGNWDKPYVVKN